MLNELPPLPQCDILDPGRFGVAWQEESVRAYGQACQAATLATVTPLVTELAEAVEDGLPHGQACAVNCGGTRCDCRKHWLTNKARAFLSGATKEINHAGVR